jgi:histidyl-tRNA synthetase
MVELRNLKGTKDINPQEKLIQNYLINIITNTFQKFGFNPLETPILEFLDILSSKYAGGAEILKEMFTLKDNGDRELALRYDLTVPFCRFVGMNPDLKLPFKRYEIGKVFRDGPIKLGRLREFYQCDADVVGSTNLIYDAECLAIFYMIFTQLGHAFYIEFNNRKLLFGIIKEAGIDGEDLASSIILSIDKLKKIGIQGVQDELIEKGVGPSTFEPIFKNISIKGSNSEILEYYEKSLKNDLAIEGIREIRTVLEYCNKMGISNRIRFRPELARGLQIYTGTIFEAFLEGSEITSSVGGGGRYDKIIGRFLDSDDIVPAIGLSIGLDVILSDVLNSPEKYPQIGQKLTCTEVLLIPIKIDPDVLLPIIMDIRQNGINCELFLDPKKSIRESLGLASYFKIPITVMVGKKELDQQSVTIKDMTTEKQETVEIQDIAKKIKLILKK